MASAADNSANAEVFLYTGPDGAPIPDDVVRVRVDPAVTEIPARAFSGKKKLEEVELGQGIRRIGDIAFISCASLRRISNIPTHLRIGSMAFSGANLSSLHLPEGMTVIDELSFYGCSIQHLSVPTTLRRIEGKAFRCAAFDTVALPDGLEIIDYEAFSCSTLNHLRIPPRLAVLQKQLFSYCQQMFSLELSDGLRFGLNTICKNAFRGCCSLRNVAIPAYAAVGEGAFDDCRDLNKLFPSQPELLVALKHRFDDLPIHKLLYYQSYHPLEWIWEQLDKMISGQSGQRAKLRSKTLNPAGKQQDCLGMTPLHILACSSRQDLALYQVMVGSYPENLIAADKWGALPLLYAVWRNAPDNVVQFLVDSYWSTYPDYVLNWTEMVETLVSANAPEAIQNLLDLQATFFPQQEIEWDAVLERVSEDYCDLSSETTTKVLRLVVKKSIMNSLHSIGVKRWRDEITEAATALEDEDNFLHYSAVRKIRSRFIECRTEYLVLKEATTALELVLWKKGIDEAKANRGMQLRRGRRKRTKLGDAELRQQCRISCGAESVVENVLLYLLPAKE